VSTTSAVAPPAGVRTDAGVVHIDQLLSIAIAIIMITLTVTVALVRPPSTGERGSNGDDGGKACGAR
jgi:hypothetical protein